MTEKNSAQSRGGSRKHPPDCKCGHCPKMGRPKSTRPVDGNLARKIKAKVQAEKLWIFLITTAAKKAKDTGNTADLRNALEYLDNRDLGNCIDTVNHLHDKPLEANITLDLGAGMSAAMKKASERLAMFSRKHA